MKKFAKLIPVALGLLTLASCSNDDFFTDKVATNGLEDLGAGDLVVYEVDPIEDGDAFTRAWESDAYGTGEIVDGKEKKMTYFKWGREDQMKVYDKELHKYDIYSFQSAANQISAFRLTTSRVDDQGIAVSNIKEPRFAMFPKEALVSGHWDYNEKSGQTRTTAKLRLSQVIQYDGTNYKATNGPKTGEYIPVFENVIPRWGEVELAEQGYLITKIRPLTGILRLRLIGTPDYAQYIKVQMIDHETGKPVQMNGIYSTCISTDDVANLSACLANEGVINNGYTNHTGIPANGVGPCVSQGVYPTAPGDELNVAGYQEATWVDMNDPSRDFDDVNTEWQKKSVVYVPLPCTPGHTVDIVAFAAYQQDGQWHEKEIIRIKDKEIQANHIYQNENFYNLAVDGYDVCSINDALATAEPMEEGGENIIILNAMNPIGCTSECHTIQIPNIEGVSKIIINLSKGLFNGGYNTLNVQYLDNNDPFEGDVAIIAGEATGSHSGSSNFVNIDTKLATKKDGEVVASGFGLAGYAFGTVRVDAKQFVFGDGKTATWNGDNTFIVFSDNVEKLTVSESAALRLGNPAAYNMINIPEWENMPWTEGGYSNANLKNFQVNGVLLANINAPEAEVKVVVGNEVGMEKPALLIGGIRTKYNGGATGAAITVQGRSALIANPEQPETTQGVDDQTLENQQLGFGSYGNIVVTGQSFINGPAFSKEGDIKIKNVDLNGNGVGGQSTFWGDGAILSDIVFSTLNFEWDPTSRFKSRVKPGFYGPLYAEEGSVKIEATNSMLAIGPFTSWNQDQIGWLNPEAQETTSYSVYAKQDIEIGTTDWATNADKSYIKIVGTIAELGGGVRRFGPTPLDPRNPGDLIFDIDAPELQGIWAEQDVKLYGRTLSTQNVRADRDFTIRDLSLVSKLATVGRYATINVDAQDGNCEAVNQLKFVKDTKDGNKLYLYQGYINELYNRASGADEVGYPVLMEFADEGAFAAIKFVAIPDQLFPKSVSIWNGEQMPKAMKDKYVVADKVDLWTASELAAQLTGVTNYKPVLRSDINLNNYDWEGIKIKNEYTFTGFNGEDSQKKISNLKIVNKKGVTSAGFIGQDLSNGGIHVKNLFLDGVSTEIGAVKDTQFDGVGALAGKVKKAEIEKVSVKITGAFGSDGEDNLDMLNVGGVLGHALGAVTMKGVTVDTQAGYIAGWAGLGGLIGKADAGVEITDAAKTDDFGALNTSVTENAQFRVTLVKTNAPIDNSDTNQGKVGLYIGTVDNLAEDAAPARRFEGDDDGSSCGDPTPQIVINVTANGPERKWTRFTPDISDESLCFEEGSYPGDTQYPAGNGIYFFARSNKYLVDLEIMPVELFGQGLIGFSGFNVNSNNPVMINGKQFFIAKYGTNAKACTNPLYYVLFRGATN